MAAVTIDWPMGSPSTGARAIAGRVRLRPAAGDRPEVIYFNSEAEQVEAVLAGVVDAIARGEVGNLMAARARSGLRVTAFDDTGREPVASEREGVHSILFVCGSDAALGVNPRIVGGLGSPCRVLAHDDGRIASRSFHIV